MKTSHRWFRVYMEMIYDPKLLRLPVFGRWLWIVLLALAKQSPCEGQLLVSEGVPLTVKEISHIAGVSQAQTSKFLSLMEEQKMLLRTDRTWSILHWDERQFISDDVSARAQRSKQRSLNEDATLDATSPEQNRSETEQSKTDLPPISPSRGRRQRREKKSPFDRYRRLTESQDFTIDPRKRFLEFSEGELKTIAGNGTAMNRRMAKVALRWQRRFAEVMP